MPGSAVSPIVSKIIRLSSEASSAQSFVKESISALKSLEGVRRALLLHSSPPTWTILADVGSGSGGASPAELASEALETGDLVSQLPWLAVPLAAAAGGAVSAAPFRDVTDVLALHVAPGGPAAEDLRTLAQALGHLLAQVRRSEQAGQRIERLQAILDITHQWHQTDQMEVLLNRMAEAATRLFEADRASIFLWDKPNRTLVGRPALGIEGDGLRLPDDAGVVGQVVQTGETRRVDAGSQAEVDRTVDRQSGYHTKTILCVPLVSPAGTRLGAFELLNKRAGSFTAADERGLVEFAAFAAVALENTQQWEQLVARHQRLLQQASGSLQLLGESKVMQAVKTTVERIADTELAVLILGENGTGKEVVAHLLHHLSRRRDEPLVAVNCAALTETLLESELFGHEKGAFTDAHESRAGKFELAHGGTLFLDEIGDMSLSGQAKLLRVLEEKKVVRVGGNVPIHADVRVLAATNQDLAELVRGKRFRQDLFFRLNVVSIEMPPLRERGDDVLLLADHFLTTFCRNMGRARPKFTAAARKRLASHHWPGNVRELRNLMERLAYLTSGDKIEADDLAFILAPTSAESLLGDAGLDLNEATRRFQEQYIQRTIERARGNVSEAARVLGVHRSNLYRKMKQLGMETDE